MAIEQRPLVCGKWFDAEAGQPLSIDILIGEGPGGHSGFILLIQTDGEHILEGIIQFFN